MARELEKLHMNIPKDLNDRVIQYAERMCLNKTSAVIVLLSQALDSQKAMGTLEELMVFMKSQQDEKDITEKLG